MIEVFHRQQLLIKGTALKLYQYPRSPSVKVNLFTPSQSHANTLEFVRDAGENLIAESSDR
jgi:hypothetical protein